jgi:predicted transcriptional regulator
MLLTIGLDEKTSTQLEQMARVRSVEPVVLARDAMRTLLRNEAGGSSSRSKGVSDQMAVFRRVEEAYGGQPVLIRQVRL